MTTSTLRHPAIKSVGLNPAEVAAPPTSGPQSYTPGDLKHKYLVLSHATVDRTLPNAAKAVLTAVLDHVNVHSPDSWPGIARLMRVTQLGRRTVTRALRDLQERGYVVIQRRNGTSNRYSLGCINAKAKLGTSAVFGFSTVHPAPRVSQVPDILPLPPAPAKGSDPGHIAPPNLSTQLSSSDSSKRTYDLPTVFCEASGDSPKVGRSINFERNRVRMEYAAAMVKRDAATCSQLEAAHGQLLGALMPNKAEAPEETAG